jgi:hypothetical protein
MGVATAIIGHTIAATDTIARTTEAIIGRTMGIIGRTMVAMGIVSRTMVAMGVRPFTLPYHQFRSPSVAATGKPRAGRGGTYSADRRNRSALCPSLFAWQRKKPVCVNVAQGERRLSLLSKIEITSALVLLTRKSIRGNLVAPNLKDGSSLDGDASSCGRPVRAFAGIGAGQ